MMRRFQLNRSVDETGVSGTGVVAQGVQFDSGWCAMTWISDTSSLCFYPSINHIEKVHGHNGKTVIDWIDGCLM